MKNLLLTLFLIAGFISLQAKEGYEVNYNKLNSTTSELQITLGDFNLRTTNLNGVDYTNIIFDGGVVTKDKGFAEVPFINANIQLGADNNVALEITGEEYSDFQLDFPLVPSRGVIYRNQDPSTIPYQIDPNSLIDEWYPGELFTNSEPYIIRDVRGMNIQIKPFAYNSVQNKLRVYTKLTVRVYENNIKPVNPILNTSKITSEMPGIYSSIFINYNQNQTKWANEIDEFGEILVIYTSANATVIQPWITWKKEKGYTVHEEEVATGTNVKTLIETEYNANNNILYVQLVGDWADVKSDLGTSQSGPTDPMLGCVVGGDDYYDLMVGRFSASSTAHVTTQGDKTISYERDPEIGGTWYSNGLGIGSHEGPGDDNETDQDHIDIIKENRLLPFTYTNVDEAYGASVPVSDVSTPVNNGLSVINYCGHGDHDFWVTSGYSNTNVNSSTNGNKLPFVFSVACIVGEFHTGGDCLAEAMLRKDGGGALVTWMATINQPWQPPMRGQDYANDVLTQGYDYTSNPGTGNNTTYGKTTFGSITFNAGALMISEVSSSSDWDTYKTWTIFGDASVQVRTEMPKALVLSNEIVTPGTFNTTVTVAGNPFENAIVSLYKSGDPQPYSALTDASGSVSITHPLTGTVKLTVTGFNLATYSQDKVVDTGTLLSEFSGTPLTIPEGGTVDFTDLSVGPNTIISWDWTFPSSVQGSSTIQNPTAIQYNTAGNYDVTLTVGDGTNTHTTTKPDYIHVTGPLTADFSGTPLSLLPTNTVDFTDLSLGGSTITDWDWTFAGGTPGTSTTQNPTIQYDTPGIYQVSLTVTDDVSATDTKTETTYIEVIDPNAFNTDFYANFTTIIEGGTIDFYDDTQNGPATTWSWEFTGAETPTSIDQNPTGIQYMTQGTYIVKLTSSDGVDTDDEEKIDYITVVDSSFYPEVDFVANFTTVFVGNSVDFFDLSTGSPDTWAWTFTGGIPNTDTLQNPTVIIYDTPGVYPVTLKITSSIGNDTLTKIDYITVIDNSFLDTLWTDFRATTARLIQEGSSVSFEDLTAGYPTDWTWNFEGGTPLISNDQHPLNITYLTAGSYDVQLIVTNGIFSDTLTKGDFIIVTDGLWQDPNGFCDTINNLTSNDIPLTFRHLTPDKWGYFPGHNGYTVKAYAEKFTNYTFSNVQGMLVPVIKAYSASSSAKVKFTVWDMDTTGYPGNEIETIDAQIGDFTPYLYHSILFDNPAPVNGTFFVGFQLFYSTPADTFAIYMAPNRGIGGQNTMYVKRSSDWMCPSDLLGDTLNTALGINLIGCLVKVKEIDIEENINIYPNPSNNIVNIDINDKLNSDIKVAVYDIFGRELNVSESQIDTGNISLNFSEYNSGIYLIYITVDEKLITKKITIIK